jgi:hypothetical protein
VLDSTNRVIVTYAKSHNTHQHHGDDVQPGVLQPLAKGRPGGHAVRLILATRLSSGGSGGCVLARSPVGLAEESHDGCWALGKGEPGRKCAR